MHTVPEEKRKLKILLWITVGVIIGCLIISFPWGRVSPLPFLLELLALATAVTIPIVLGHRRLSLMAAWLALYLIVYGILSSCGGYISHNLGGSDNRETWFPAYCDESYISRAGRHKAYLNALGSFFLPLVMVDRTLVHRTHFDAW